MRIKIDYHKQGLEIEVPDSNLLAVLSMNPASPISEPIPRIAQTLKNPIASEPLGRIASKKKTACVCPAGQLAIRQ